jgi:hypothetical protein
MFCVPFGMTANFATVSEIRGTREKIAKGVGKTAFAGLFRLQRGLAKGYWHGELGTLEGQLHHFEITPPAPSPSPGGERPALVRWPCWRSSRGSHSAHWSCNDNRPTSVSRDGASQCPSNAHRCGRPQGRTGLQTLGGRVPGRRYGYRRPSEKRGRLVRERGRLAFKSCAAVRVPVVIDLSASSDRVHAAR